MAQKIKKLKMTRAEYEDWEKGFIVTDDCLRVSTEKVRGSQDKLIVDITLRFYIDIVEKKEYTVDSSKELKSDGNAVTA